MTKTAFITDWLDKYGGAERVVTAINEIYEFDYYYAYVNKMSPQVQKITFAGREVKIISSNIMSCFKYKFRVTMPIFPLIIKMFNKQTKNNEIDLVISSSWTMSKGYRIGKEIHVCYLQSRNFKYVWDEADLYFKGPIKLLSFIKGYLQTFDLESAKIPDHLISNSLFVQNWVKEKYKRDSVVIYPPVDVEDFYISDGVGDYYITVGRLEPYKRFDIVIEAFTKNKKKLVVIGDGTELKNLKSIAGSNIEFTGYLEKVKIKEYLSKSKAFVFAGVEDFGIVIVEAHASGVPSIVFNGGAATEIVNEVNGLCYEIQSAESLNEKIIDFENQYSHYNKNNIRESSLKFSKERFKCELKRYVELVTVKCLPMSS
jgi:glycosyltransferase involved in cell wall biosynthesis